MEGGAEQAVALIYALKAFYPETMHHMDAATFLASTYTDLVSPYYGPWGQAQDS